MTRLISNADRYLEICHQELVACRTFGMLECCVLFSSPEALNGVRRVAPRVGEWAPWPRKTMACPGPGFWVDARVIVQLTGRQVHRRRATISARAMKAVNPSTVTAAELFAEPPAVVDRADPVAATMELNLDVIWACVAL